jgi:hypothetical protein
MKKSIVGDPIIWPGLIYAPLNTKGLLYALGTVSSYAGLIFEEFDDDSNVAFCRKKTDKGWEKIKVSFGLYCSDCLETGKEVDLMICWIDDLNGDQEIPCLALSTIMGGVENPEFPMTARSKSIEKIFPDDPTTDLKNRGNNLRNFEQTISELDEHIKKLKNQ